MLYMECLGCRIANGIEPDLNIVYENEFITCVLDIAPFNEGHTLILPKKHYYDVEEMEGNFNDLTHYHMHLIPRYEGDGFIWGEPLHPHGTEKRLSQTKKKILKTLSEEKRRGR